MHPTHPSPIRWPAEWEPHAATWLAWPHNREDWPGKFEPIPWVYASIIKLLSRHERVRLIVSETTHDHAIECLNRVGADGSRIDFFHAPTDRVWTRDYAPIFVLDDVGWRICVKWKFNAWAKYANWDQDDAAGHALHRWLDLPSHQPVDRGEPIVLEGGAIDGNGRGTLLTTEECLLSPQQNRNLGFTWEDYEKQFTHHLGVRKTLWLKRGIAGDDTHGHVDDLARFVAVDTVVAAVEDDPGDVNHEPLRENLDLLRGMTNADGDPLKVIPLPMPAPIEFDGQRLPASYANFYIANKQVLVPTFNDPRDRQAMNILAELFPDREVVGVYCGDLVLGLGTLHCMTMQEPIGPTGASVMGLSAR